MYLNFEDICMSIFKCLIWTIFIFLIFHINVFNYNIGVSFCGIMEIPKDFTLTMVSPGMAINVTIIMFVMEMIVFFFIVKKLRKIQIVNKFFEFLCDINI